MDLKTKPNIYFASAIRGDSERAGQSVILLIQWLKESGFTVLNDHIGDDDAIEAFARKIGKIKENLTAEDVEKQDIDWLNQAEYVIAEISGASTGTGREIEYARTKGKFGHRPAQILCLYNQKDEFFASPMIRGMTADRYENISIVSYNDIECAKKIIKKFLKL